MKSVKPGRGPSMMGVVSSGIAIVFGIAWTGAASNMGAPSFFPVFGVLFVVMGIVNLVYNFKNATGENRFSMFDITDGKEEPDPLETYLKKSRGSNDSENRVSEEVMYCPYCGNRAGSNHDYCSKCGRKLSNK